MQRRMAGDLKTLKQVARNMSVLSVRPKVAELVFQLYGRNLHPELFEVFASQSIKRGDYEATVKITAPVTSCAGVTRGWC